MQIALSPGTLKIGRINFVRNFPKIFTKFVLYKSSVAIKKGKRLGSTELDQRIRPAFAASKLEEENRIKLVVKSKNPILQELFKYKKYHILLFRNM